MMRVFAGISFVAFLSGAASGQSITAGTPPTFEIADVHVSPKTLTPRMSGGVLRGTRFEMHQATMVDLVRVAYGVDPDKVLGGPSWLEVDRFERPRQGSRRYAAGNRQVDAPDPFGGSLQTGRPRGK